MAPNLHIGIIDSTRPEAAKPAILCVCVCRRERLRSPLVTSNPFKVDIPRMFPFLLIQKNFKTKFL